MSSWVFFFPLSVFIHRTEWKSQEKIENKSSYKLNKSDILLKLVGDVDGWINDWLNKTLNELQLGTLHTPSKV